MGIDALTNRNDGSEVGVPVTHDDWKEWVSAGRTRNWMLGKPIIDWLGSVDISLLRVIPGK